jgi:hypothetical protein
MELPGSSYLYNLALISMTFGGFAVLIFVIRQTIGGRVSRYDIFFMRTMVIWTVMVVVFAMTPAWLTLFGLPHSTIWRLSSLTAAVLLSFLLWYRLAGRHSLHVHLPKWATTHFIFDWLVAIFLLMNSLQMFFEAGPALYVGCINAIWLSGVLTYLYTFEILLAQPKEKRRK